ncbi:MAG: hypothetical protein GX166_09080 [Clostridiaceae bacterium]|nr:hypothetical protein [Clostridiaceae bacterium]
MDKISCFFKKHKKLSIFFSFVLILLLGYILGSINRKSHHHSKIPIDENAVSISPSPVDLKDQKIKIPAVEKIYFDSSKDIQDVSFVNPPENICSFVITLKLPNKEVIYQSAQIPPNMAIYKITLDKRLEKGKYKDSIITYHCYAPDGTKMNSAEFLVDIVVR